MTSLETAVDLIVRVPHRRGIPRVGGAPHGQAPAEAGAPEKTAAFETVAGAAPFTDSRLSRLFDPPRQNGDP